MHFRRFCSKQNDNSPQSTGTLNFNIKLILFLEGPYLIVQADPKLFFFASAFQVAEVFFKERGVELNITSLCSA